MNIREIFYELINEAVAAKVVFDDLEWPISFNTVIYENEKRKVNLFNDNNMATLVIKNEELFFNKLEEYIKCISSTYNKEIDRNELKIIITYLFSNATVEDFINPILYMDRLIKFINDNTFDSFKTSVKLGNIFNECNLDIEEKSQSVKMETTKKMSFNINNGEYFYSLPDITYGIRENSIGEKECYIYSIINPKEKKKEESIEEVKFKKKIHRLLFKVDEGIDEKRGEEEYPSTIKDVSASAVISLLIFMELLEKKNINIVKAVPYLPIRYSTRRLAALGSDREEALLARNNKLQGNITNKFLLTFERVAKHRSGMEIVTYPYQVDEFLTVIVDKGKILNNKLLSEVENAVTK